ncbi:class I SAM-dependent methyltransferase [Pantoea ananatis]|uniref:class I SAM-dependent methyltransferase n=1 Tax=Pantoea ananas TaxID=553 RepID=UPI001B30A479|nr:class I SAM-dependent methyltransferase [Pantoea ananatis]
MIGDVIRGYSEKYSNARVIEIGCGKGRLSKFFSRENQYYVGVDIQSCDDWKNSLGKNISFLVCDGIALPFERDSFDFVIILNSLHHFKEPIRVLNECYRVCSAQGTILIIEPQVFGDYTSVLRPYEDETETRLEAQQDLKVFSKNFESKNTNISLSKSKVEFESFDYFIKTIIESEEGRVRPNHSQLKEMKDLFLSLGVTNRRGNYLLEQDLLVYSFRMAK